MKKIFVFLLVLTMILTACSGDKGNGNGNGDGEPEPSDTIVDTEMLKDFTDYISQGKAPQEVKEYLDGIIPDAGTKTADALVGEYLDFMADFMDAAVDDHQDELEKLSSYFDFDTLTIDPEKIQEAELKEFFADLTGAGFKFVTQEGMLYLVIDYRFGEAYSNDLSTEMKDYFDFMALNSDKKWASDAELVITLSELAERIASAERFMTLYPEASRKDEILGFYKIYLGALLGGIDNTPLVNFNTKKIETKYIEAYEYFIKEYPELTTTETVRKFNDELKADSYNAPYTYAEYEKHMEFAKHVKELVDSAAENY